MERTFEKSLCLGTGIPFAALIFIISIPNAIILVTLYRNPLRCFRKTFTVFLAFITATDLFVGSVVCTGLAITRFLCSLRGKQFPGEGDIPTILGYIGINSSILMVTAMSVDRLVSVVCPHFYLNTVKPKTLVLCNSIIVIFSAIFFLPPTCWDSNWCVYFHRYTSAHDISSYHDKFVLFRNILCLAETRSSRFSKTGGQFDKYSSWWHASDNAR